MATFSLLDSFPESDEEDAASVEEGNQPMIQKEITKAENKKTKGKVNERKSGGKAKKEEEVPPSKKKPKEKAASKKSRPTKIENRKSKGDELEVGADEMGEKMELDDDEEIAERHDGEDDGEISEEKLEKYKGNKKKTDAINFFMDL